MTELSRKIINIIQRIPKGKVLTYGGVAALAGSPRAARQVSWILNSHTESYNLPWHRVINSQGKISIPDYNGYTIQKNLLLSERVVFNNKDEVDLKIFMWNGK